MADKKPFFITGANAKLVVNNVLLALATDVEYNVEIAHATPRVLGQYECQEVQPLMYSVRGSFRVIRYVKDLANAMESDSSGSTPVDIANKGNGIGSWEASGNILSKTIGSPFGQGAHDARTEQSLDPGKLSRAMMFDMEVRQVTGVGECRVFRIRNARITGANMALSKRNIALEQFTFEAQYYDGDSFIASMSGIGQHLE